MEDKNKKNKQNKKNINKNKDKSLIKSKSKNKKTEVNKRKKNINKDEEIKNNKNLTTENQYESMIFKDGAIEDFSARLNKTFILIIVSIVIMFIGASKNATVSPNYAYIPVDDEFKIIYGITNKTDTFETEEVVSFVNKAIEDTFSFNYINYNHRIQSSYEKYYTSSGARSLDNALRKRNFFKFLSDGSLKVVESRVLNNALIKQEGESSNGLKAYVLEVDIELTLLTGRERKNSYTYTIVVEQVPVTENRSRLGISSIQQK